MGCSMQIWYYNPYGDNPNLDMDNRVCPQLVLYDAASEWVHLKRESRLRGTTAASLNSHNVTDDAVRMLREGRCNGPYPAAGQLTSTMPRTVWHFVNAVFYESLNPVQTFSKRLTLTVSVSQFIINYCHDGHQRHYSIHSLVILLATTW